MDWSKIDYAARMFSYELEGAVNLMTNKVAEAAMRIRTGVIPAQAMASLGLRLTQIASRYPRDSAIAATIALREYVHYTEDGFDAVVETTAAAVQLYVGAVNNALGQIRVAANTCLTQRAGGVLGELGLRRLDTLGRSIDATNALYLTIRRSLVVAVLNEKVRASAAQKFAIVGSESIEQEFNREDWPEVTALIHPNFSGDLVEVE